MHSTFSDGALTPSQLVEQAVSRGLDLIALTDHDEVAGAASLAKAELPLRVIPGVELSIRGIKGLHLLGYGAEIPVSLTAALDRLREARIARAGIMLDKLDALGCPLDRQKLFASCRGSVGRTHIARAMAEAGFVRDVSEAFSRYLEEGGPAWAEGERLDMAGALALLRSSGFVPVLAHPALLEKGDMTLRALLEAWRGQGLMGVEVYHPSRAGQGFGALDRLARRMGLLVTGGSDFHTPGDWHGDIGCMAGFWPDAQRDAEALLRAVADARGE